MLRVEAVPEGVRFAVRVIPRAKHDAVAGVHGGALKVRLTAPPVEGKANAALEGFLAQILGLRRAQVRVVAGYTSRQKTVVVTGVTPEEATARLTTPAGARSKGAGEQSGPESSG